MPLITILQTFKPYESDDFLEVSTVDFSNASRNLQIATYLQTLRLEQNLTLEQLSTMSQVPVVHLTSIEEGQFLKFDNFYLKMYLKKYTQALEVDLEQLYAYASQQPLQVAEQATNKEQKQMRPLTQTQADISAVTKPVMQTVPKRKQSNPQAVKRKNLAQTETKRKISHFLIGLVLLLLAAFLVFFLVNLIRDMTDREVDTPMPPPENPHTILTVPEEVPETTAPPTEPETTAPPEPTDFTQVETEERTSGVQTFYVTTSLEALDLRITHSGSNWISDINVTGADNITVNTTSSDDLEETIDLEDGDVSRIQFRVGAIHNMDAIYINDVPVDFYGDLNGPQDFIFYVNVD